MSDSVTCPDCGTPLSAEIAPEGLCPECLLQLGLAGRPGSDRKEATRAAAATAVGAQTATAQHAHRGGFETPRGPPELPHAEPALDSGVTETVDASAGALFAPGKVLAQRYRLGNRLGAGGMGEVWHALDLKLRVDVALKSVRSEIFKNERALELLRREVRSAREVISPNVCRIFDLIEIEGHELVSMEYVDGQTLTKVLRTRSPLALREATEIASQFLSGLVAIHAAGLIHRDIKPENIMLTRSGRVVLMDFGLAKPSSADGGSIAGTPAYMAPEQLRGEALDARADIFAAGIVLAEMTDAAGVRDGESRARLHQALRQEPPRLSDNPWAPVLRKAVAQDAAQRYGWASELTRALEEVTLRVEGAEDLHPYPGLASFTEQDAEYFFGREVEIEAVWKKLRRPHLLALIGPSGAGKTSFIRAGLLPAQPAGWRSVMCHPGDAPTVALGQALVPELSGDTDAMGEMLRFEDADVAVSLFARWRKQHDEALVVVDQFEELFTLNPPEVQSAFTDLLGRLALEADVHVLLSMRDDFLFHCHKHPALLPILSELTLLGPPAGAAMRRALIQPALLCGYRFEDEKLVDEMLEQVGAERGALPLLAFAVSRLWEQRDRDKGLLTREAYQEIGGVGGALAQHAEATIESIGRDHLPLVREIFRNLVTAEGTRAARDVEDLLSIFDDTDRAENALRALVDARLLTSFEYTTGEGKEEQTHRRIEIIHESLITAWPRLVRWRSQDEDSAHQRDQLRQVASMWKERGQPEDLLWTATSYKEFEVWRERYAGGLTATEESFAQAMTRQNERRRRQRRMAVGVAFALLLAVLAVVGTFWRQSVLDARRADASNLFALGQNLLQDNPTGALAYATASLERADNPEVRKFVLEVLWRGPTAFVTEHMGEYALSMNFSPDGERLAAGGWRGLHNVWNDDGSVSIKGTDSTGLPKSDSAVISGHSTEELVFVEFSADAKHHVSRSDDGVRIWSMPEAREQRFLDIQPWWFEVRGQELLTFTEIGNTGSFQVQEWPLEGGEPADLGTWNRPAALTDSLGLLRVDVDPSGKWLAYADGRELYELPLDRLRTSSPRRLAVNPAEITRVVFHPDGDRIATVERVDEEHGLIRLWSRLHGSTTQSFRGPFPSFIDAPAARGRAIQFDPEGRWMAAITQGGRTALLWDLAAASGAKPLVLQGGEGKEMNSTAIHPDGAWLAAADTSVALWPLNRAYPRTLTEPGKKIDVDPLGRWFVSTSWEGQVQLWTLDGDLSEQGKVLFDSGNVPTGAVQVGPEGRRIAVGLWDGRVLIIPESGDPPTELKGFTSVVFGIDFDREGRRLAAGGQKLAVDSVIRVWDLESGAVQVLDAGDGQGIMSLDFTPDGHLLSGSVGGLFLWDLESGTRERLLPNPTWSVLGPEGRYALATCAPEGAAAASAEWVIVVYDLHERVARELPTHGDRAYWAAWHPTGRHVLSISDDGAIRVGPVTGEEPHLLLGLKSPDQITVHPDGNWFFTGGRLWPMPEGRPFHTLPHAEFLDHLRAMTNFRVVADANSTSGYRLDLGPFPGWENLPKW